MKDNRGMTMVEILVVIAIIAVVGIGATIGFTVLNNSNVTSVAKQIDSNLSTVRLENMSKQNKKYIHIRCSSGSYYMSFNNSDTVNGSDPLGEEIGTRSVDIYTVDGATEHKVDDTLTISFKRTGEVEYYSAVGTVDYIKITNGSKTAKLTITDAGKHFVE